MLLQRHIMVGVWGCFLFFGITLVCEQALGALVPDAFVMSATQDQVFVERKGKRQPLSVQSPVYQGDIVITEDLGKVQLRFSDGTIAALGENTEFGVCAYSYKPKNIPVLYATMNHGQARFIAGKIVDYNVAGLVIETTQALIVPHGGSFAVHDISGDKTAIEVAEFNRELPVTLQNVATKLVHNVPAAGKVMGATVSQNEVNALFFPSTGMTDRVQKRDGAHTARMASQNVCGQELQDIRARYIKQNTEQLAAVEKPAAQPPIDGSPLPLPPIDGKPLPIFPADPGPILVPPVDGGPLPLPPVDGKPQPLPPVGGGPAPFPPLGGGPIAWPPIAGGPIVVPPVNGGPLPLPPMGGGPLPLPPFAGGPLPLPPVGGGPLPLPPLGGGPGELPPIDGGPVELPPIGGGPIEILPLPEYSAHYAGTLTSWGNLRGNFSFDVLLSGSSGELLNAVLDMNTGSVEYLRAINGSSAVVGGAFDIHNFTVGSTNIAPGAMGKTIMTGTIAKNRLSTGGDWKIMNSDNMSIRHDGQFSGKP